MKILKTVLAVVGIVALGGGVYLGVAKYSPMFMSTISNNDENNTSEETMDSLNKKDDLFGLFPYDTQMVISLDLSPENQSIVNLGMIRERYPFTDKLKEVFMEGFNKELEGKENPFTKQLREPLEITAENLWDTVNGPIIAGISFDGSKNFADFTININVTDNEIWKELLTTEITDDKDNYKPVKISDDLYYSDVKASMEESGKVFDPDSTPERVYFSFNDNSVTISSYDLGESMVKTLGDNDEFNKHWTALPDGNLVSLYVNSEIIQRFIDASEKNPNLDFSMTKSVGNKTIEKNDKTKESNPVNIGFNQLGLSLSIMPDELVIVETVTPDESSFDASTVFSNSKMELNSYLPKDTLALYSQNNISGIAKTTINFIESNIITFGGDEFHITDIYDSIEETYGLDVQKTLKILFGKNTSFSILEVDNPMIPASIALLTEVDGSNKENVRTVISSLEDSIIKIISDDLVSPDRNSEYTFLKDKTEDFSFRKFVPNRKFQLGVYHTLDILDDIWIVASSEEGLKKIFDTKEGVIEPISENARYQEIAERINHSTYNSFVFIDMYRIYRLVRPFIGAGMSEADFATFQEDIDPYLEKIHSIYGYSTSEEDGMIYEKYGFVFE